MDTIYYGGPILTMEQAADAPEAVLVQDGTIAAVGTLRTVLDAAGATVRKVDLQGHCLLPGFIDPHGHIAMAAQMHQCADLAACTSFTEIETALRRYIEERKLTEKDAVIGFGYDHNFLQEQRHPDRTVLDRVSDEIPILILHVSGHLACANSAMLRLAGVDGSTPDPEGGRYGRMQDSTEPDGYMEESAMMAVQQAVGKRIRIKLSRLLREMQQIYIEHGITTAQDGATAKSDLSLLKLANRTGKLKIDVVCYPLLSSDGAALCRKNRALSTGYHRHLRIGGYKMLLDGSPQGRSAWLSQPYVGGAADFCGYPWLTDEQAYAYARQAIDEGRQLLAHCNGDAASQQFLDVYEKALADSGRPGKEDLRPVMIHCQTVRQDQLERMARLQMIPSIFVGHVYYWGDVHLQNLGDARGNFISPVRAALDCGLRVTFHQDPPVTKPDMLHSIWCAVNRISRSGRTIGAEQRIDVYEALRAVTVNGAYQYGEEATKGTIRAGKRADLVILDRNPLETDPMALREIRVLETIKDGKTLYQKK